MKEKDRAGSYLIPRIYVEGDKEFDLTPDRVHCPRICAELAVGPRRESVSPLVGVIMFFEHAVTDMHTRIGLMSGNL